MKLFNCKRKTLFPFYYNELFIILNTQKLCSYRMCVVYSPVLSQLIQRNSAKLSNIIPISKKFFVNLLYVIDAKYLCHNVYVIALLLQHYFICSSALTRNEIRDTLLQQPLLQYICILLYRPSSSKVSPGIYLFCYSRLSIFVAGRRLPWNKSRSQ